MGNSNKIQSRAKYIAIGAALIGLTIYVAKTENYKNAMILEIKEHNAQLNHVVRLIDRLQRNGAFDNYFRY